MSDKEFLELKNKIKEVADMSCQINSTFSEFKKEISELDQSFSKLESDVRKLKSDVKNMEFYLI